VGVVSFAEAFEQSSNVVFAKVSDLIPPKKFYKYIRDFGFGNTLGIDINGEVKGRMPKPKEFRSFTKRFISHGYSVSATALQMLEAYSTVANLGNLMKPYVVKTIYNPYGEVITEFPPQKIRRVISEETAKTLIEMLCGVVENGTGKNARIKNVRIGGKTGTSQQLLGGRYSKQNYTGSFIGFFPADNPKVAMIVIIDRPIGVYYGGSTAAPLFNSIARRWIAVNPELSKLTDDHITIDTITVPSVKGFFSSDALQFLRDYGLRPSLDNLDDGIIIRQDPVPGTQLKKGDEVKIFAKKYQTLIRDTLDKKFGILHEKPEVLGISVKKAVAILHKSGIKVKIIGSGVVAEQKWLYNADGELVCTLYCNHK
jgi:membrane carboxypeptidase/penicillin-binding protein PbpC